MSGMERWREYFESSGVSLWTICERALALAYLDDPDDFPSQRDRLAQKLYAPEKLDLEMGEEQAPKSGKGDMGHRGSTRNVRIDGSSGTDGDDDDDDRILTPTESNYDEAEALTDEMEEENLVKRDVFEIKDTLLDSYKSEKEFLDSLQRLELMQLSFDVLKETEIGKIVKGLRKHSSARVRALAKKLVSEWKDTAEQWYKSVEDVTAAAKTGRPIPTDSPLDDDQDGLPSPPMDEGALLAGQTASIDMCQLFDFMDDETSAGSRNPSNQSQGFKKANGDNTASRDSSGRKNNDPDIRRKERDSITSSNNNSKREKDDWTTNDTRVSHEKTESKVPSSVRQISSGISSKASKPSFDASEMDQRLLAAKKKLHENYQQAENAKRQRTIQVMNLEDLPKGGPKRAKASHVARGKPLVQHRPQSHFRR